MKLSMLISIAVGAFALAVGCHNPDHGHGHGEGADHSHAAGGEHHPKDGHGHGQATAKPAAPKVEEKAPEPVAAKAPMTFDEKPAVGTKALCPVMKNEFVISQSSDRSEHEGKHYAFCCPGCKPQFDAAPKKFIDG